MRFIVVEVKGKDLFTVYDTENKGVCCCSSYTLLQLLDMGHEIIGCIKKPNGRLSVFECGLDGKQRAKKASVICTDETKRSATTIARGLDEKHYPRTKQERRGSGSIVKLNYMSKQTNTQVMGKLAIQYDIDTFILEEMTILKRSVHPEMKIENYAATEEESQYMQYVYDKYEQKERVRTEINKSREEINKKITELNKQLDDLNNKWQNTEKTIKNEVRTAYLDRKYAGITGNEKVRYSFTGRVQGNLIPEEAVPYLIKRTKRKLLYTHGLSYRSPTTHNEPVTAERALQIIKTYGWYDIDATHDDYIHINTYSDNDMW